MASLAQQESESISQNVRIGHQYRMQQGKPMVNTNFMGYRMSQDKSSLVIVPEQAVVVRRIFREFLDGRTRTEIANGLMDDHVPSPSGADKWYPGTISSMLKNEKFMGDLLLQKWYIKDVISKQAVRNNGKFPKYYVENAHAPIVPKEIFMQVRGEFLKREHERENAGTRAVHRSGYPFYEKIFCSECGSTCRRFNAGNPDKANWRCKTRIQKGTPCNGRIVKDNDVKAAVVEVFGLVSEKKDDLKAMTLTTPEEEDVQKEIDALTAQENDIHEKISMYAETGVIDAAGSAEKVHRRGAVEGKSAMKDAPEGKFATKDAADGNAEIKLEKMKIELNNLRTQKNELLKKKAVFNRRRIRAKDLLSMIDSPADAVSLPFDQEIEREAASLSCDEEIERQATPLPYAQEIERQAASLPYDQEIERQVRTYPASCTDVDDFFRRTNRSHGPVTEFRDSYVDQYIEKVVIFPDHLTVVFKAGIEIEVK